MKKKDSGACSGRVRTWSFLLSSLFVLIGVLPLHAQAGEGEFETKDFIYASNIKSVKFSIAGFPNSLPIVELNSSGQILLTFDDLDGDFKDIRYRIVHCDMNWSPTDIPEQDYIRGFNDELLRDFEFSSLSVQNYTHYNLTMPNKDLSWTLSGNYLLHLYRDDTKEPLLTRRFCVVEPIAKLSGSLVQPVNASRYNTSHELDFSVQFSELRLLNPMLEIRASVLQNNRWDNAFIALSPSFVISDVIHFDFQDKIIFPASKEFRPCDIRSTRFKSEFVNNIELTDDGWYVAMKKDKPRSDANYLSRNDINGSFVFENADRRGNGDVNSEYVHVLFRLETPEEPTKDFYVVGAFCDWSCREGNKMIYDEKYKAYIGDVYLKQGYYDYMYASSPVGSCKLDFGDIEGDWYETENSYNILIYYRGMAERYDRLMANGVLNSN